MEGNSDRGLKALLTSWAWIRSPAAKGIRTWSWKLLNSFCMILIENRDSWQVIQGYNGEDDGWFSCHFNGWVLSMSFGFVTSWVRYESSTRFVDVTAGVVIVGRRDWSTGFVSSSLVQQGSHMTLQMRGLHYGIDFSNWVCQVWWTCSQYKIITRLFYVSFSTSLATIFVIEFSTCLIPGSSCWYKKMCSVELQQRHRYSWLSTLVSNSLCQPLTLLMPASALIYM